MRASIDLSEDFPHNDSTAVASSSIATSASPAAADAADARRFAHAETADAIVAEMDAKLERSALRAGVDRAKRR